jgi:hypothetical protein
MDPNSFYEGSNFALSWLKNDQFFQYAHWILLQCHAMHVFSVFPTSIQMANLVNVHWNTLCPELWPFLRVLSQQNFCLHHDFQAPINVTITNTYIRVCALLYYYLYTYCMYTLPQVSLLTTFKFCLTIRLVMTPDITGMAMISRQANQRDAVLPS